MNTRIWFTRALVIVGLSSGLMMPGAVLAQDSGSRSSVDIFLEDTQLDVEADIPSVELVLTFKGLRYETIELKKTFLPELYETVGEKPF